MSHRPLTNTSSLKIAAAYSTFIQNNPTIKEKMPIPRKFPANYQYMALCMCVCGTADESWRAGIGMY
jgi:hypothetical protein